MKDEMSAFVERAIRERVFPGCVIGIVHATGERQILSFGRLTYDGNSPEARKDTVYDLASVTKSIPVASLAAMLESEGKVSLGDKVAKFIPELRNDFGATIEDLLRYRVRGERMSTLKFGTFEEIRTHIFERGFDGPPGESDYTNLPAFLLGIILERAGGEILPALAHKYFFGSLGMNDTTFFPHDIERIASTEIADGKEIRGIVHDESARVFLRARRAVGHAGLFSTAPDLLRFLEALLQGKFPTVVDAAKNGLGWQREGELFGSHPRTGVFGKTGFTGTSVVVDRERGIGFAILSNRTYPKRPSDSSAVNSFRADIADLLFSP